MHLLPLLSPPLSLAKPHLLPHVLLLWVWWCASAAGWREQTDPLPYHCCCTRLLVLVLRHEEHTQGAHKRGRVSEEGELRPCTAAADHAHSTQHSACYWMQPAQTPHAWRERLVERSDSLPAPHTTQQRTHLLQLQLAPIGGSSASQACCGHLPAGKRASWHTAWLPFCDGGDLRHPLLLLMLLLLLNAAVGTGATASLQQASYGAD